MKIYILFFIGLLFFRCSDVSNTTGDIDLIEIDPRASNGDTDVSDFMSLVQVKIPKNDSLNYPIVMNKAFSTDEYILILDFEVAQGVYCYSVSGEQKWRKKFGQEDNPFDPISVSDIHVYNDTLVELYDDLQSMFYYYRISDGSYVGKEYVDFDFYNKMQVNDTLYVFTKFGIESGGKYDTLDLFFIANDQLKEGAISYDPRLNNRSLYEPDIELVKSRTHLIYLRPFNNILYSVEASGVKPIATLSFKGYSKGNEVYEKYEIKNTMSYILENNFPFIFGAGRYKDLYFFFNQNSTSRLFTVFDRTQNSVIVNSNILKFGDVATVVPFTTSNDKLYSLSTMKTDELIKGMVSGDLTEDLRESMNRYNEQEDDSDIIINIMSFK